MFYQHKKNTSYYFSFKLYVKKGQSDHGVNKGDRDTTVLPAQIKQL